MDQTNKISKLYQEALDFHSQGIKGKLAIDIPKPLANQRDLGLAYSPGVAAPCLEIYKNPNKAFEYTSKGNFVAVISNGTAVLGLGNLGALASKPVMEGKAALFKRFAGIDAIDIEVDTENPQEFINAVKYLGKSWGGINLEDIKAPECFIIEKELQNLMDIPVFHDDQHGTAITVMAGLINATDITKRNFADMKVVVNGAGAAALACINLLKSMGLKASNVILCDTQGVIFKGRKEGMNEWKEQHAIETKFRTLEEVLVNADVFLGLSKKGTVTKEMVKSMAKNPIIFAMANPDPEITPEEVMEVRSDAIIATGRSDYPNQVNNVMCFPYIFRGALDVQATAINEEMKIAAAHAIANLARKEITDEVAAAYGGNRHEYGPNYIIPVPFDSRLIQEVPIAVAKAAMETGVAAKPIEDFYSYRQSLAARLNPSITITNFLFEELKANPKKMIFAAGEEECMINAALQWTTQKYGEAVLVGDESVIKASLKKMESENVDGITITNYESNQNINKYTDHLYHRLQRQGYRYEDCVNLIKNNSTVLAAEMLQHGEANSMVAGLTKGYITTLNDVSKVIDKKQGEILFTLSALVRKGKMIFLADTAINEEPTATELADIAIQSAKEVRNLGHEPRVAFVSFSTFGNPMREGSSKIRDAVKIMDSRIVDFEYDGELAANVSLNEDSLKLYPFCRLSKPANILIMPGLLTAHIASKLLHEFAEAVLIGPILCGTDKNIQICQMGASLSDILNSAAIAAVKSSF